jgi:hypothetical protein
MKRNIGLDIGLALALVVLITSSQGVASQKRKPRPSAISEEKAANTNVAEAPPEAVQLVRDVIAYVSHEKPDIANDKAAQTRWLSDTLRKALDHRLNVYKEFAKKNADSPEGPPGNSDFVGSWDYPTSFTISGSRRYDNRAIVDVVFKWGAKTQYPGDTRLASYVLAREGAGWKLDDIYTFRGEYVSTGSLSQTFSSESYP